MTEAPNAQHASQEDQSARIDGLSPPNPSLSPAGLYDYAVSTAHAIGVGAESVCCSAEDESSTAYVALDQRCREHPESDLALLWRPRHGWTMMLETGTDGELVELARLSEIAPHDASGLRQAGRPGGNANAQDGYEDISQILDGLASALRHQPRCDPGTPAPT